MRLVLPVLALLVSATVAEGQQRVNTLPNPVAVTAPELPTAPGVEAVPLLVIPGAATQDGGAEPAASQDAVDARPDAPEAGAAQQVPHNFWWLVGGIVLAGVILAVIL